ncbi:hypothetical protein B4U80_13944 [Leptotrombidium deliense]|uniref:Choline/ethanolamine kinase-like protein n=1 Tax=Leptotrombidium deliense TaxID=299467 RepID=A0A443S6V1_9ACAR|nr:hypothetical protein B4U80_13944 [Leptotrombidium deliense]
MNAMIKDEGENLFEKLYIIDYESCDYNYRGYDLAHFLYGNEFDVLSEEESFEYNYLGNIVTNEMVESLLNAYLNEMKIIGISSNYLQYQLCLWLIGIR